MTRSSALGPGWVVKVKAKIELRQAAGPSFLLLAQVCRGTTSLVWFLCRVSDEEKMFLIYCHQVEALDKLTTLTDSMKEKPQDTAKDRLKFLSEQMRQRDYMESLQVSHRKVLLQKKKEILASDLSLLKRRRLAWFDVFIQLIL